RGHPESENLGPKITPDGIGRLNQLKLPGPPPLLDSLLAQDRLRHRAVQFKIHQAVYRILLREPLHRVPLLLKPTLDQVRRYADIKRAVALAREDVDGGGFFHLSWMPAFAGMTFRPSRPSARWRRKSSGLRRRASRCARGRRISGTASSARRAPASR